MRMPLRARLRLQLVMMYRDFCFLLACLPRKERLHWKTQQKDFNENQKNGEEKEARIV